MHNFGVKFLDKSPSQIEPVLDYAIAHGLPVEVGLYARNAEVLNLLQRKLDHASIPINAHTDHFRCHAFNLHDTLDQLEQHIRTAQSFGSSYSVMHVADLPMTERAALRPALHKLLLDNLERAEALCTRLDYHLHIENVWHPISFYSELFQGICSRQLTRIHSCFDIGHAKIWSGNTLEEWLDFNDELLARGFRVHCHLHANQGFADEHLSMTEVDALCIGGADDYYNPYGYPNAFWQVADRFPEAVKVFEVKPEHAIANLEAVLSAHPGANSRSSNDDLELVRWSQVK